MHIGGRTWNVMHLSVNPQGWCWQNEFRQKCVRIPCQKIYIYKSFNVRMMSKYITVIRVPWWLGGGGAGPIGRGLGEAGCTLIDLCIINPVGFPGWPKEKTIFLPPTCKVSRMSELCRKELLLSESLIWSDGPMSESWGWPGCPQDYDRGTFDHTGDSDNSSTFRYHFDITEI